jgi:hypothetical protein
LGVLWVGDLPTFFQNPSQGELVFRKGWIFYINNVDAAPVRFKKGVENLFVPFVS